MRLSPPPHGGSRLEDPSSFEADEPDEALRPAQSAPPPRCHNGSSPRRAVVPWGQGRHVPSAEGVNATPARYSLVITWA